MDVVERLLWLCGYSSVTGAEGPLAEALAEHYADQPTTRVGDSLVVGQPDGRPLVALVGHLDTVPPTAADERARVEERPDGPVVVGRGTSDMKGGVAVAEAVFADRVLRERSAYGLALVLYAREEGPADDNELSAVLAEVGWLADTELAVILEPTDLEVQVGCLGGLHARLAFTGRDAHSARPWQGDNALTAAGELLTELDTRRPHPVTIDGVTFFEVVVATQAWTDNPRNVVPGRFTINVNYRFAPTKSLEQAEDELCRWVDGRAQVTVVDRAPPASPPFDVREVARFLDRTGAPVAGKQAWTDVARLTAAGVPAVNYGPGLADQAHQAGEHVPVTNLHRAAKALRSFLSG